MTANLASLTGRDLPPLAYAHNASHNPLLTRPESFRSIAGSGWVKPANGTGLWTAPVTAHTASGKPADSAWLEWCRSEDWGVTTYTHLTDIIPGPDTRVLLIDTAADLLTIVDMFPAVGEIFSVTSDRRYPDWPALAAAGWDAVYLTNQGQWETRLPPSGPNLYSWDCATVLWLRPNYEVGGTYAVPTAGAEVAS